MGKKEYDRWRSETLAEAFGDLLPEGSKRFWQGRRARGRLAALGRESGTEDPRFGKATFPLAPPPPGGYNEGGGGVAGVSRRLDHTHYHASGEFFDPQLSDPERRWLTEHGLDLSVDNRVEILRRIQSWDAEVAERLSRLRKHVVSERSSGGREQQELSPKSVRSSNNTALWRAKARSRKRTQ